MKPISPFSPGRHFFPKTDYCFHTGLKDWGSGFASPYDDEDRSEFRMFNRLSRDFLIESARERTKEMVVFSFVVVASAWPVIYMVITVVKLLSKAQP